MDRIYRFRIGILVAMIFAVIVIYSVRLFALQLVDTEQSAYSSNSTTTYTQTVSAARGEILDRHGTVLVSNRATYSVTLNSFALFNAEDPNGLLLRLAETCKKNNISYQDGLPLSADAPFTYTTDSFGYTYKSFLLGRQWDADMSPDNLAKKLRSVYRIPDEYTDAEARMVMGLRYELDLPAYANASTYVLTEDVSAEQLAILKELAIPGMDVTTSTVREYNTTFAAQLLGHVGPMFDGEYEETYEALGYAMDAKVGHDGLEQGFEQYLHGTDGVKVVTVASDGTILDEYWEVEPQSGSNVITTIDIGLTEYVEKALGTHIRALADSKAEGADGYDANAGAVVVMNPRNGEVLTAANYPTYDPSDYLTKYDELLAQDVTPLRNRAMDNAYPPGSTFKLITAVAAMRAGVGDNYTVDGQGYYRFSDDTVLSCWIAKQGGVHGVLDMRGALAQSCNIYFYTVGQQFAGIEKIDETAWSFGIGQDPGSEVYCNHGQMASPEVKAETYAGSDDPFATGWFEADTATAAIGQSLTEVTPLQLCRYACAMANQGTLYNATFLHRVVSSDFQTLVQGNDYTPAGTNLLSNYEYTVIYEGTRLCVEEGTAKALKDYPIEVCAKTGTASHGTGGSDHGVFICWAPAQDPEIAIAIYVEHGASGSNFAGLAADIMDYYFSSQYPAQEINVENQMTED